MTPRDRAPTTLHDLAVLLDGLRPEQAASRFLGWAGGVARDAETAVWAWWAKAAGGSASTGRPNISDPIPVYLVNVARAMADGREDPPVARVTRPAYPLHLVG